MKFLTPFFCFLFLGFSAPTGSTAQPQRSLSWKEHTRLAEKLEKSGKTHDAAEQYELAWRKKPTRLEFVCKAADLFYKSRDYRKAIEYYALLKDDAKNFPRARLQYALSLKQNGQYDEANPEFLIFLNNYAEKDRAELLEKVEEEIAGCSMGIRMSERPDKFINIEYLPSNSPEADLSPAPFADDILYFTVQNADGGTALMRTQQSNGEWQLPDSVTALPIPKNTSFGNGAFSPDFTRYYYTQFEFDGKGKQLSRLYCLRRTPTGWATPVKLRDYINLEGTNTTHPNVVQVGGKREILYFASDRKGGKGGMDIWYTVRDLRHDDLDFELPKNAGTIINTTGDEITPFYDPDEGCLYFSSNGRATLGGYDVFKTKGQETRWITPENLGFPLNSPADDAYFVKNRNAKTGFLVSNRLFGTEKLSSLDDDIFVFNLNPKTNQQLLVQGSVLEKDNFKPLLQTRIVLYEIREKGEQRLLTEANSTDGKFQFLIFPDKEYQIEVESDGFRIGTTAFSTKDSTRSIEKIEKTLLLEKYVFTPPPQYQMMFWAWKAPLCVKKLPKLVCFIKFKSARETILKNLYTYIDCDASKNLVFSILKKQIMA